MRLSKQTPRLNGRPKLCCSLVAALIQVISLSCPALTSQALDANQKPDESGGTARQNHGMAALEQELTLAESSLVLTAASSPTSHEILASGWPLTSPMWPSIETETSPAESAPSNHSSGGGGGSWRQFIYSDEPSKQDYSLLLSLNASLIERLLRSNRTNQSQQLEADLTFEYYFNFGPQVTALPGIKIELDRKELDYLEPTASSLNRTARQAGGANRLIKSKMWLAYSRRLVLTDAAAQLGKPDWLKLSLVNREAPSLVAIRSLKASFGGPDSQRPASATSPRVDQATSQGGAPSPAGGQGEPVQPSPGPVAPRPRAPQSAGDLPPPGEAADQYSDAASPADPRPASAELDVDASNPLTSTIKPVDAKKRGGWTGAILGRKRRQAMPNSPASTGANGQDGDGAIELTCFSELACDHWRSSEQAVAAGQFRWSLARMPPSIEPVQNGYYYASNRLNYGDQRRSLLLRLNQTESATITDQRTDHCIELALYVTEGSRLHLYRMLKRSSGAPSAGSERPPSGGPTGDDWLKMGLLLTWAPTTNLRQRAHLKGGQMAASKQSGWILETLCYGDFFEVDSKCGLGECAFAFEMSASSDGASGSQLSNEIADSASSEESRSVAGHGLPSGPTEIESNEQVVGVALLSRFAAASLNKHAAANRWLEFWQRQEVEPDDNWNFYPKTDYSFGADNVSLLNLYDEAHYSIQSDWIQMSNHLNLGATLAIELLRDGDNEAGQNGTASQSQAGRLAAASSMGQVIPGQGELGELAPSDVEFRLIVRRLLVNQHFETIYTANSTIDWLKHYNSNETHMALWNMPLANVSELILAADQLRSETSSAAGAAGQEPTSMFKVIIEVDLDCHGLQRGRGGAASDRDSRAAPRFRLTLANVSLADRCFPSPCEWGTCNQNGTGLEDWDCKCDKEHRGRRCQFGAWCGLAHVAPPALADSQPQQVAPAEADLNANQQQPLQQQQPPEKTRPQQQQQQQQQQLDGNQQLQIILKTPQSEGQRTQIGASSRAGGVGSVAQLPASKSSPEAGAVNSNARISGDEFCKRKLGLGFRCQEIDLPLDDKLHLDEGETFVCSCRGDFYLSDEGKCKQAHRCHSLVCEHVGEICDDTKPFNETKPCHCNEKLDWFPRQPDGGGCVRRQCHDKRRDCGFDAHLCLPGPAGERPTCKCGPKFALKTDERGNKRCQSSACVLPTLNDCEHICTPDDTDLRRPFTCSCHPGFTLDKDGRSCHPNQHVQQQFQNSRRAHSQTGQPLCKPACDSKTQICTELGCRCRQGYLAEGELVVQVHTGQQQQVRDYVQSVRCLNVCSLSYAENKAEFERIESVCPFGLCDPDTFNCRCSDPNSSSLVQSKYEPIWASNNTDPPGVPSSSAAASHAVESAGGDGDQASPRTRASPLCRLKRVCQPESAAFQLCKARGAICVPDYTKPAMFDCVCPPSSERRPLVLGPSSSQQLQQFEFNCGPRCSSIKQECLKKQAICRQVGKDQVRCDCPPGMMLDKHDDKCYLAHFTYALQLIVVNKYYEPSMATLAMKQDKQSQGSGSTEKAAGNNAGGSISQADDDDDDSPISFLQELVPQSQRSAGEAPAAALVAGSPAGDTNKPATPVASYASHYEQQCNTSQLLHKSILEDPYEHDMNYFRRYADQCAERLHEGSRTSSLNSQLAEDIRKSVRQHLHRPFSITTNNSLCHEMAPSYSPNGRATAAAAAAARRLYLNCTVFLQSMEPIEVATIERIFSDCDETGSDGRFCWLKPRLLLARSSEPPDQLLTSAVNQTGTGSGTTSSSTLDGAHRDNPFGFRQIVACELEGFCGPDAQSERLDPISSMCSCRCPAGVEMIDVRDLEPPLRPLVPLVELQPSQSVPAHQQLQQRHGARAPDSALLRLAGTRRRHGATDTAVKQICAPRDQCASLNSSFCLLKPGSRCHYDIRLGSQCQCVWPAYEDELGQCVEVAFSRLDNTLIVIIIMVGTCLIVSLAVNLYALARSRRGLFSRQSRQYPLSEFSSPAANNHRQHHQLNNQADIQRTGRPFNRSTGVPNLAFDPDD